MHNNAASRADLGDDFNDCNLAEVNCELAMLGGQMCSIPYELYDLPDLREILSIDTWDSCLTDEERFFLSAYLPDMDQETFLLTIKELLNGSDLHFGNPTYQFFERLKGGLYPPKVACLRDCLRFLQMKKYYYSLRSYHQNMVQTFKDMAWVWDRFGKKSSISERLHMWIKQRKHQELDMLDLNTVPINGFLSSKEVDVHASRRFSDTVKSIERKRANNTSSSCSLDRRSNHPLKVRKPENNMLRNHHPKVIFSELEPFRSVPKGLLKVVPKVPPIKTEQRDTVPRNQLPALLINLKHLQDYTCMRPSISSNDIRVTESSSLRFRLGGNRVSTATELPKCVLNRQDSTLRSIEDTVSSARRTTREADPIPVDITSSGKHLLFGNRKRLEFTAENKFTSLGFGTLEQNPFGVPHHLKRQHPLTFSRENVSVYSRLHDVPSRTLDISTCMKETGDPSSSKPKNGKDNAYVGKSSKVRNKLIELEGVNGGHIFPLTYKRRKLHAKT